MELSKKYESNTDKFDFTTFATEPIIPFDAKLTSRGTSVGFHSFVLKKISSVFRDLLEGDKSCIEIKVNDVHPNFLEVLQYVVYLPPDQRNHSGLKRENVAVYEGSRSRVLFKNYASVHTLIVKYDVKLLEPVARSVYDNAIWKKGQSYGRMYNDAKEKGLEELACSVEKSHLIDVKDDQLETFDTSFLIARLMRKSSSLSLKIAGKRAIKKSNKELWKVVESKLNEQTDHFRRKWLSELMD